MKEMGASLRICDVSCVHNSGKEDCMRVIRVGPLLDSLRCDTPCRSRRPHGNSTKPNGYIWLHKGAGVRDEHRGNLGHSFRIGLTLIYPHLFVTFLPSNPSFLSKMSSSSNASN